MPNLDIMGEVPFVEDITSITDSRGIFAESSRVIRSNISFKLKEGKSNVILSTSSIKGEGKTMVFPSPLMLDVDKMTLDFPSFSLKLMLDRITREDSAKIPRESVMEVISSTKGTSPIISKFGTSAELRYNGGSPLC